MERLDHRFGAGRAVAVDLMGDLVGEELVVVERPLESCPGYCPCVSADIAKYCSHVLAQIERGVIEVHVVRHRTEPLDGFGVLQQRERQEGVRDHPGEVKSLLRQWVYCQRR
ncbi:hypothetical protein ABZY10_22265 [Streptomyces sp. NPDC006539]|uniref:hypothetical protein n=1 Tax=Streptomyces sp. NPDC006539 TaxID=3155352 RepID=UPI0033A3C116